MLISLEVVQRTLAWVLPGWVARLLKTTAVGCLANRNHGQARQVGKIGMPGGLDRYLDLIFVYVANRGLAPPGAPVVFQAD